MSPRIPKEPKKHKVTVAERGLFLRLDADMDAQLDALVKRSPVRASRAALAEAALRAGLPIMKQVIRAAIEAEIRKVALAMLREANGPVPYQETLDSVSPIAGEPVSLTDLGGILRLDPVVFADGGKLVLRPPCTCGGFWQEGAFVHAETCKD